MKRIQLLFAIFFCVIHANAQKLPALQTAGVKVSPNIKIDGKATEWGDRFEAYNPVTELHYTMANDNKKLYLVVQTSNEIVMNRIARGGLKLVIQKNRTKSDEGAPFVKYPFLEKGKSICINFSNDRVITMGNTTRLERAERPATTNDADKLADSLAQQINQKLTGTLKWIYTGRIQGVDTLISVYNDKGIEAACLVNSKKIYTCEMAIDLSLFGLSAVNEDKFSYHIVINGDPFKYTQLAARLGPSQDGSPFNTEQLNAANETLKQKSAERSATTDFWGEYTLAK